MKKRLSPFCGLLMALLFIGCGSERAESAAEPEELTAATSLDLGRDIIQWKDAFPLQAAGDEMNHRELPSPTGYNGSVPFQRWDLTPEIKTNFRGIAFSVDYKEDRGHVYAWEDLFETERTSDKTPGACITCKTSDVEVVFQEYGWDFASMKMIDFEETAHAGIDCLTCHSPENQHLRVVQPAFAEAMEQRGVSVEEASRKQMRSYVCAQCHSEYYFEPGSTRVVFPWANGLSPAEMYSYYEEQPAGFTGDFTNPLSDTRLLKAQHPDYEMFQSGIHAAAGIACADCHMPRVRAKASDGTEQTVTQHWITSPLQSIDASCLGCHRGKNEPWMLERVRYIQDSVFASLRRAGLAIEEAHRTIEEGTQEGVSAQVLDDARVTLREAQWYWDFTASANSGGFHNSELAHSNLSLATDLARQSIATVLRGYSL